MPSCSTATPFTLVLDRLPLAVLEFSTLGIPSQLAGSLRNAAQPGAWLQVRSVPQSPVSANVDYYPGLFADGITLASEFEPVSEKFARTLSAAFGMDDIPDETEAGIAALLDPISALDFVAVYDVGQGNLNALWEADGPTVHTSCGDCDAKLVC
jgi:hypothetical protein